MSNTFNELYIYTEVFDYVYEPAEGGYYVETSWLDRVEEASHINVAIDKFKAMIADVLEEDDEITFKFNFDENDEPQITIHTYDDGDISLWTPHIDINRNGYIGSGCRIGISFNEPKPDKYMGYC